MPARLILLAPLRICSLLDHRSASNRFGEGQCNASRADAAWNWICPRWFSGREPAHYTLLDLGAGDGRFVAQMARAYPDSLAIGIDACRENLIEQSRRAPENADLPRRQRAHASSGADRDRHPPDDQFPVGIAAHRAARRSSVLRAAGFACATRRDAGSCGKWRRAGGGGLGRWRRARRVSRAICARRDSRCERRWHGAPLSYASVRPPGRAVWRLDAIHAPFS